MNWFECVITFIGNGVENDLSSEYRSLHQNFSPSNAAEDAIRQYELLNDDYAIAKDLKKSVVQVYHEGDLVNVYNVYGDTQPRYNAEIILIDEDVEDGE